MLRCDHTRCGTWQTTSLNPNVSQVVSLEMLELQRGLTSTATLLASLDKPTLASPVMPIAELAGGSAVAELARVGMGAELAGPGIVVAEWEAVLAAWQARFVEAQAQVSHR